MILTNGQNEALKIIIQRHKDGERYVVVSGFAGVGKSTLVKFAIEALNVEESKVAYAAFTGKAAEVLRKKGNKNAMTLHKLLYDSIPMPGGGYLHKPKSELEYTIIVVDECSMAPKTMINLLLSHKVFVIFIGDPFQLPVIDKEEAHDLLDHPHIFLSEVMRQAAESEIIQMTMKIRNGESIKPFEGKEVIVMPRREMEMDHLLWADQCICATNKTRHYINERMRNALGYSGLPQDGERMICIHNYWDDISTNGESALVNGSTGIIRNPFESFRMAPRYVRMQNHRMDNITANFITDEGDEFHSVEMDKVMIEKGTPCLEWRESYALGKLKNKIGDIVPRQFTYGYCITGHKAQGSQWKKILVIEEWYPSDKKEHAKWLYTCCTRPEEKLVLVLN